MPYSGSCSCANLRWTFNSTPTSTVHCWCKSCRLIHAAPFVTWSIFPAHALEWQGEHRPLNREDSKPEPLKQDGERKTTGSLVRRRAGCCTRNSCAECGTPVMITEQDVVGIISVPTALLTVAPQDGTTEADKVEYQTALRPTSHIWLEDRVDWCVIPEDGLPRYQRYEEKDRNDKLVK